MAKQYITTCATRELLDLFLKISTYEDSTNIVTWILKNAPMKYQAMQLMFHLREWAHLQLQFSHYLMYCDLLDRLLRKHEPTSYEEMLVKCLGHGTDEQMKEVMGMFQNMMNNTTTSSSKEKEEEKVAEEMVTEMANLMNLKMELRATENGSEEEEEEEENEKENKNQVKT